jgi:hypothetical protein
MPMPRWPTPVTGAVVRPVAAQVLALANHRPMAAIRARAHRVPMAEIILLIGTGLAFLVLLAAVALELDEERREERELGVHARVHKP